MARDIHPHYPDVLHPWLGHIRDGAVGIRIDGDDLIEIRKGRDDYGDRGVRGAYLSMAPMSVV